jgi:hypothetical protein
MGKRGRAEDKGKGEDDDLIGMLKAVAISTPIRHFKKKRIACLSLPPRSPSSPA